jgi:hypothetical protein
MAAGNYTVLSLPIKATAAITQYRGLTVAGAVPAAGANGVIARTAAAIGDVVTGDVLGTAQAEAGAAFAIGTALEFDASARVITKASGVTIGRAVTAASAAGDVVEVLLIPN